MLTTLANKLFGYKVSDLVEQENDTRYRCKQTDEAIDATSPGMAAVASLGLITGDSVFPKYGYEDAGINERIKVFKL